MIDIMLKHDSNHVFIQAGRFLWLYYNNTKVHHDTNHYNAKSDIKKFNATLIRRYREAYY